MTLVIMIMNDDVDEIDGELGRFWTKIQSDNCFETVSTPGLLLEVFFPALCHFCIGFHRFAKSQWAGKVFSGGFVSKTLR